MDPPFLFLSRRRGAEAQRLGIGIRDCGVESQRSAVRRRQSTGAQNVADTCLQTQSGSTSCPALSRTVISVAQGFSPAGIRALLAHEFVKYPFALGRRWSYCELFARQCTYSSPCTWPHYTVESVNEARSESIMRRWSRRLSMRKSHLFWMERFQELEHTCPMLTRSPGECNCVLAAVRKDKLSRVVKQNQR